MSFGRWIWKAPQKWKQLPSGPRLQGLVMLPYKNSVIRVGGFTARNAEGEDTTCTPRTKSVDSIWPRTAGSILPHCRNLVRL